MRLIARDLYQVAPGETVQIRIEQYHNHRTVSVVVNESALQINEEGVHEFQITRQPGEVEIMVLTCTFLPADPNDAVNHVFVRDKAGQQWIAWIVKKDDPQINWQTTIRFVVAQSLIEFARIEGLVQ